MDLLNLPKTDAVEAEDVTVSEILLHNHQLLLRNPRNANVLQTKVDAQCDKLAIELS